MRDAWLMMLLSSKPIYIYSSTLNYFSTVLEKRENSLITAEETDFESGHDFLATPPS